MAAAVLSLVTGLLIAQSSNATTGVSMTDAAAPAASAGGSSAANAEQRATTQTPDANFTAPAPTIGADGWIMPKASHVPRVLAA